MKYEMEFNRVLMNDVTTLASLARPRGPCQGVEYYPQRRALCDTLTERASLQRFEVSFTAEERNVILLIMRGLRGGGVDKQ